MYLYNNIEPHTLAYLPKDLILSLSVLYSKAENPDGCVQNNVHDIIALLQQHCMILHEFCESHKHRVIF